MMVLYPQSPTVGITISANLCYRYCCHAKLDTITSYSLSTKLFACSLLFVAQVCICVVIFCIDVSL